MLRKIGLCINSFLFLVSQVLVRIKAGRQVEIDGYPYSLIIVNFSSLEISIDTYYHDTLTPSNLNTCTSTLSVCALFICNCAHM